MNQKIMSNFGILSDSQILVCFEFRRDNEIHEPFIKRDRTFLATFSIACRPPADTLYCQIGHAQLGNWQCWSQT